MPKVWVVAPENWSGTVPNMQLITYVNDHGSILDTTTNFNLTIDAVASSVTINPTLSFNNDGGAYHWTDVNLNANMTDLDGSETLSVTLAGTALDDTALFRLSSDNSVVTSTFDANTQTWTLSGIASNEINNVQILYHDISNTQLAVTAHTVDGSSTGTVVSDNINLDLGTNTNIDLHSETQDLNIVTSDTSTTVTGGTGNDTITGGTGNDTINGGAGTDTINAGAGNDTIMTDGLDTIDGGAGVDTIKLDTGISLDYTKLDNIEVIDLTANGNHTIAGLKLADVVNITDTNNDIKITGDSGDTLTLNTENGNTWSTTSNTNDGAADVYVNSGDSSVTVTVDENINTSII